MLHRYALILGSLVALVAANAQPMLPPDYLDQSRRVQGDQITFCVLQDSVLTELNEQVAKLLGSVLLIDTDIYAVSMPTYVQALGYRMPLSDDQLFFLLNNECDVFMGYLYGVGTYPEWLITTAPYLNTRFVLVSPDPDVTALSDMSYGTRIGTQLGSAPNSRMNSLIRSRPEGQSWRRIPYPDNEILLERVADGTVDAALVWEPAVIEYGDAALHVAAGISPLPAAQASFTITMMSGNAFLQTSLDAAIAAVVDDGSLRGLVEDLGIPAETLP